MDWATRRRFFFMVIAFLIVAAFTFVILIAVLHKTPSCADGIQNQDESGIDCGGSCPNLCASQQIPPTVLFKKILHTNSGRTDLISSIRNNNGMAAAKKVPYKITIYVNDQSLNKEIKGNIDLPPGATQLIYIPNVTAGNQKIESAFLEIKSDEIQWFAMTSDTRIVPTVLSTKMSGSQNFPIIEAVLMNPSATPLSSVRVIIFVYDKNREVITASQTIVPIISSQGQATASFTWNEAFSSTPANLEIVPDILLP